MATCKDCSPCSSVGAEAVAGRSPASRSVPVSRLHRGKLEQVVPGLVFDHAFGREFPDPEELKKYAVAIHCGGCMITAQKLLARIRDLDSIGVPYTNYGVFLSYAQGCDALRRVLLPWGIDYAHTA